jgi:NTE family protein
LLLVVEALPLAAAEHEPVVLLLSGGGARGAAHVGVLKVLEEERVRIDAIVGTSMGALVGGLYASGMSAAEIERLMLDADWDALFRDQPERPYLSYHRKQDDREFLVRGRVRLHRLTPRLPLGAIDGRHVTDLLRRATERVAGVRDFRRLPIPFRAVATDLGDGEPVVLDSGDLVLAMRASMAVPGVFAPVQLGGNTLIDGGVSENLAIEVAGRDGPARILAVDIASPPLPIEQLGSPAAVVSQAVTLLMARETDRQIRQLDDDDLLIRPALGTFSSAAFARAGDAMEIGEEAARAQLGELRRFSVSEAEYEAWRGARSLPQQPSSVVTAVAVTGPDDAEVRATKRRLSRLVGRDFDSSALQREAERVRATDLFESVDTIVEPAGSDGVRIDMHLVPRAGGADSLLTGLRLRDDFEGGTDFDLGLRWIGRNVSKNDLEMRVDLRGGERQLISTTIYRPLGAEHRLFLEAGAGFRESPFALYASDDLFLRLRRRDLFAQVDLGAALGLWGEARVGLERRWSGLRRSSDLGFAVGNLDLDETLLYAKFGLDTFDDREFPGRGAYARASVTRLVSGEFDPAGVMFVNALAQGAVSLGRQRLVAGLEYGENVSGRPSFPRQEAGGLFRLSGYAEGELRGDRLAIAHVRVARELFGASLRMPAFVGASLEAGDVLPDDMAYTWERAKLAGALFVAVDSYLGPVYVQVGFAEGGRRAWAFTLGRQIF